jgi:hypothetical protein
MEGLGVDVRTTRPCGAYVPSKVQKKRPCCEQKCGVPKVGASLAKKKLTDGQRERTEQASLAEATGANTRHSDA